MPDTNRVEINYKKPENVKRVFFIIPIVSVILFLITKKYLFLLLFPGVYIPHFFTGLLLIPAFVFLYIANSFYALIFGRPQKKLYKYFSSIYSFYVTTFYGILILANGYAPFFLQDDPDFEIKVTINIPNKLNRFYAFFRFTFLIIIVALPQIVIYLVIFPIFLLIVLIDWIILIFNKRMPDKVYLIMKNYIENAFKLEAYILGFSDTYPK